MAVLFNEDDAETFAAAIAGAESCRLSAATFVEASIVVEAQTRGHGTGQLDTLLRQAAFVIEPVTSEQAYIARQAFSDYGKGRHPAGLNVGDCFAYALSKSTGEPLLFKGRDFTQTDVVAAL